MRKFAMTTIACATLLVGGLTGCGVDNQAGDMGGGAYRGAGAGTGHAPTTEHRGMTGARYTGEGPITDMFTRDDRAGGAGRNGYGVEQRRGNAIHGGQLGVQDRHGLGNRGTNQNQTGNNAAGQRGTGLLGQGGMTGGQPGIFGQGTRTGELGLFGGTDGQRGTGITGQAGDRGMGGTTGITGQRGMQGGTHGITGQRGMTGTTGITGQNGGMTGTTGITGQRPGMVDDQGILRGQRAGQQQRFGAQGQNTHGMNRVGAQSGQHNAEVQEIKRIIDRENVGESHVVVHGDSVLIGIGARGQEAQGIENRIKQKVEREVQGLDVYVVTDREQVEQIRNMDESVREGGVGGAMEEVGATFTEMTRDLGRAAQRPFERTR